MKPEDFIKTLKNFSEEDIEFDEPHVSKRCEENNITKKEILYNLFKNQNNLINVIEDRTNVYKIYFKLTTKRQLKMIIDVSKFKKPKVLTIKIIDRRYDFRSINLRRLRR